MKKVLKKTIFLLGSILLFGLLALLTVYFVAHSNQYPSGSDTMYHIYRADSLLSSILEEGNFYPLLNYRWYNGVELMRYWAPLCAYTMALTEWIAGGMLEGYLLFIGLVCFLCSLVWVIIGLKSDRMPLSFFLGAIWFFMPNNLYALFGEGNLPRALSMAFLPLFVYFLVEYLEHHKTGDLIGVTLSFLLMLLCHVGYAGMLALASLLYLVIHAISLREIIYELRCVAAILLGFLIPGIWLVPSLITAKESVDSSETMAGFFQSLSLSLNPLYRFTTTTTFYFGLAVFLLALFGAFLGLREERAMFLLTIITLLLTTDFMYPVVSSLPGSSYLWMLRFISIALCFALYAFLHWKTLRKGFVLLFCILLILDIIPSYTLFYGDGSGDESCAESQLDDFDAMWMIAEAKSITKQRICLMDESTLGSMGNFLVSDWGENSSDATFGAGWEAADTNSNIASLNKALASGQYLYLFDRALELGNDTVIIRISQLAENTSVTDVAKAADKVGYELVDSNSDYLLYHYDVTGNFGTITDYQAIAIGTSSSAICRDFPSIKETSDTNLNNYTFEELSKYELVYLSGFTYSDKDAAEELVLSLSKAGVRVVIAADGIPEDRASHSQEFLGVICNPINFSQGYPLLDTIDGELDTNLFPSGHENWSTVYVDGLDDVWGRVIDNDYDIPFLGTVQNDNIIVVGLNLTYYYSLTLDEQVEGLLNHVMDFSSEDIAKREIVPLTITRNSYGMQITSEEDNVNTTFSYHEIFQTDSTIWSDNHLLYVNKGTTTITYVYPHLLSGALVSIIGILLAILYFLYIRHRFRLEEAAQE